MDGTAACRGSHPPAGKRAGEPAALMTGEEQAWGAARLRYEPEASCDERRFHLDLAESGDEGASLQPFLQGPGRIERNVCLDDEEQ